MIKGKRSLRRRKEREKEKERSSTKNIAKKKKNYDSEKHCSEGHTEIESAIGNNNTTKNVLPKTLEIDTYVIVAYDNDYYSGIIIDIFQEDTARFKVKVMEKSGLFGWKWLKKDEIFWYQFEDIKEITSKAKINNKQCQFIVLEMDKNVFSLLVSEGVIIDSRTDPRSRISLPRLIIIFFHY
jgi:23S rRNA G2069 N7-methylase RlmK/C1962 C5-methylase RlmI